jgi:hypothetical protein
MRRAAVLLVLAGLAVADEAPSDGKAELDRLRESARGALKTSCGRCHDHARPTARPEALRIFDLQESDWSARVTDEQMDHMVGRFEGFHMPDGDRVSVRRFLDAERARRSALVARPDEGPVP